MLRTANWTLPTTYSDGSAIDPADQAQIVTHIVMDGVEVGTSAPGATSWTGDLPMNYGGTYLFSVHATLNGQTSISTPEVSFTVPFRVPNPPTGLSIS